MNAHQRRKFMTAKHYRMPLGSEVQIYGCCIATIAKHDSASPHKCIVRHADGSHEWVTLAQVRPLRRLAVRPWYRVLKVKAGK